MRIARARRAVASAVQAPPSAHALPPRAEQAPGLGSPADLRLAAAPAHSDGAVTATDGATIAFRRTFAPGGPPKDVFVLLQGTLAKPRFGDGLANALAKDGIATYATAPRTAAPNFEQYARDLQSVVEKARLENPGASVTVGGVSAGANFTLLWKTMFGGDTPTIAMSPVVVPKFLGPIDLLKVGAGMVDKKAARWLVNTPMSRHVPLTTNPASPEAHLFHPDQLKVPAGFFDDVTKAIGVAAARGPEMKGSLHIAMAGGDQVAFNPATKLASLAFGAPHKTVTTFPGLAHDLTQEFQDRALVETISRWIRF